MFLKIRYAENVRGYSGASINGHLCTMDTFEQRTNIFVPKYSKTKDDTSIKRTPLYNGHQNWSHRCPLYGGSTVLEICGKFALQTINP